LYKHCLIFVAISAAVGLLFFYVPQIDLWTAAMFYNRTGGFLIATTNSASVLPFLPLVTKIFITVCCLLAAINIIRKHYFAKTAPIFASCRVLLFLLLSLALGPGFIVNTVIKNHSGRARPFQIKQFGGQRQFTNPFILSDQCKRNCSFVSGDAAVGYFGLVFLFIARRRRIFIASAAVSAGTLIGLIRMAQGAHFLSDVIFSGVFTLLTGWLLYYLLLRRKQQYQYKEGAPTHCKKASGDHWLASTE
jgi:lipid A 4'-phosphatase